MCTKPTVVFVEKGPRYERLEVPCRKCWACLKNRVNDLVARGLCEHAMSDWALALTLTYADQKVNDPLQTKKLHVHDFQNFMKRLRNSGHKCRYICAGEYGSRKGRAHFHVLLFGLGRPPDIALNSRVVFDPWPWGHVYADRVHSRSIRYVCKYLTKKDDPKNDHSTSAREEWVGYSLKPVLGHEYFMRMADWYASEKVVPRDFRLNPPGVPSTDKNRYQISGVSQMHFLDRLFWHWPEAMSLPKTEWMENATLRYVKWRQGKLWDGVPVSEQKEILASHIRHAWPKKELTEDDFRWHDYKQDFSALIAQDQEATQKWLLAQDHARGPEGAAKTRRLFRPLRTGIVA